jgi:hypothetical protein
MLQFDYKRIVSEVAAQHKMVIDEDDPLITYATINGIVLERVMEARFASFDRSMEKLERRAGEALGQQCAKLIKETRTQFMEGMATAATTRENKAFLPTWAFVTIVSSAFVIGVLIGRFLL